MELHNQPGQPKHGIYEVRCTRISMMVIHNKQQKNISATDHACGSSIQRQFGPYLEPPATYMPQGTSQQDKSSTAFNIV